MLNVAVTEHVEMTTRIKPASVVVAVHVLCVITGSLAWPDVGRAQVVVEDPRFERIATVVADRMNDLGVPGVAIGIYTDGKRLTRVFGVTSVENPLPVTETTLFQFGSITKTFTGTAVMRLVEQGKLRLDSPVRDYLPTFRVRDSLASQRTTVRTLLTHTGDWEGDLFDDPGNGDDALAKLVGGMATLEQLAPTGSIWSYNNAGFYAAGRLIEVVTGKPYETALKELVIDPLRLRQTFLFPGDVMTYRFAVGHAGATDKPMVLRPWAVPRAMNPAGGAIGNILDLLTYGQFHLGDGASASGERLLSPESMKRMQETQLVKHGTDEEMALAWQVLRLGSERVVWHDGFAVGQASALLLIPSRQMVVAMLTNSVRGETLNREVRSAIAREFLGVNHTDPTSIAVPTTDLALYAGRYTRPFMDVVVRVAGDRLMIQQIQKQGFPRASGPVPPPAPAAPYVLFAKDRLIGVGAAKGERVEFLRHADGTIGWIRAKGRIARRIAATVTPP